MAVGAGSRYAKLQQLAQQQSAIRNARKAQRAKPVQQLPQTAQRPTQAPNIPMLSRPQVAQPLSEALANANRQAMQVPNTPTLPKSQVAQPMAPARAVSPEGDMAKFNARYGGQASLPTTPIAQPRVDQYGRTPEQLAQGQAAVMRSVEAMRAKTAMANPTNMDQMSALEMERLRKQKLLGGQVSAPRATNMALAAGR